LDEHVSHAIAHGLWRRQIDATTAASASLLGATDEAHIAFALQEGRVIYTNDADFLSPAASGVQHAGIVYCRPGSRSIGDVIRHLALMHACMEPDEMVNRVEFL